MNKVYTRRELFTIIAGSALSVAGKAATGCARPMDPNRVVTARMVSQPEVDREQLGSLVDGSLKRMTGASDAAEAWCSLFSKGDLVSIKVNCLGGAGMSTNPLLVGAVVDRLKKCGITGRNIVIWDRSSRELKETGFGPFMGGDDVRCYGTDDVGYGSTLYENGSVGSLFSRILTDRCNKIINMPVLKDHGICGLTFALKNYFGAIHNPNKYHLNRCDPYIADLNAMRLIREREALIIGDLTSIQADGGPSYKSHWAVRYNGVLAAVDPVAADHTALTILESARRGLGRPDLKTKGLYPDYIAAASERGIGRVDNVEHIELSV